MERPIKVVLRAAESTLRILKKLRGPRWAPWAEHLRRDEVLKLVMKRVVMDVADAFGYGIRSRIVVNSVEVV